MPFNSVSLLGGLKKKNGTEVGNLLYDENNF